MNYYRKQKEVGSLDTYTLLCELGLESSTPHFSEIHDKFYGKDDGTWNETAYNAAIEYLLNQKKYKDNFNTLLSDNNDLL